MIIVENHIGKITITAAYLSALVGYTVTSCFGVSDMNDASPKEALLSVLRRAKQIDKGVTIQSKDKKLIVNLHISVTFGTNISAIADSISNKVRFAVEEATGITVSKVNVFIDGMNSEGGAHSDKRKTAQGRYDVRSDQHCKQKTLGG